MNNPRFARSHLILGPVPTAGRLRRRQDGGPFSPVCPPAGGSAAIVLNRDSLDMDARRMPETLTAPVL